MREITLLIDGEPARFLVDREGEEWVVRSRTSESGRSQHRLGLTILEPGVLLLQAHGRTHVVHAAKADARRALHMDGHTLEYEVTRGSGPTQGGGAVRHEAEERELRAPMTGVVTQAAVREGDAVTPGQALVIIEAMKMEHVVRATRAGVVRALRVRPGQQVEGGTVVAEIVSPDAAPEAAPGNPEP